MNFSKPGRSVFVTADTHFCDPIAREKFARPFPTVDAMDAALIEAVNARVGARDVLVHLGDFGGEREWTKQARAQLQAVRDSIECQRIILVTGNLDPVGERWFDGMFEEIHDVVTWKGWQGANGWADLRVVASHYPMRQWQGWPQGAVHLYGHVHGTLEELGRSTDVGVDCWSFKPIELMRVLDLLAARPFVLPSAWPREQAMREAL